MITEQIRDIKHWLTSWNNIPYLSGEECLRFLTAPITITVSLCILNALAYILIAKHWKNYEQKAPHTDGRKALKYLRWIFIFCAVCGYLWPVLHVWFPAWPLYWLALGALNIFSWIFAFRASKDLSHVYEALSDRYEMKKEIRELKARLNG